MPRPPKTIVPVDPEHQPHIKKFVTNPKKIGVSTIISGKAVTKTALKKRRRRSTGEAKLKNQKRRSVLNSESSLQTDPIKTTPLTLAPLSLLTMMSNTTLNPLMGPGTTMLQEIRNMEERLKVSMKENREKELDEMESKMKIIIENTIKESIKSMSETINHTIVTNPVIQSNIVNITGLKEENSRLNREIQYLSAEQAKLKSQLTKLETRNLDSTLIIRGIREEPKETEDMCCEKIYRELANTISGSDPDERFTTAKTLTIRKCLRLGKFKRDCTRPVSVEFVHKEDRTYILENRSYLNEGVFADKEYLVKVECIRRSLLPILRAAKKLDKYKDQSRMNYDQVVIQGKDYTLNNLHELPDDLNAFKVSSKSNDDTIGFFGEINPLSNFHPAKFRLNGQQYISLEQYIQATKAQYFNDLETYQKIMGCKTSFDCKQLAWTIKDVDTQRWDTVARSLCENGIREKFVQNLQLMHVLVEKTANKTIVECANDRLWGNGKVLAEESCLNRDVWITQGILGQILENIRAEFTGIRQSMPSFTAMNEPAVRHAIPPPSQTVSNTYIPTPMHTITHDPSAFRPTQIPPTQPIPVQATVSTNNTLAEPSSSSHVVSNPQPQPQALHIQNPETTNQTPLVTSNTLSSALAAEAPPLTSMSGEPTQLPTEDMETVTDATINDPIENNT